MTIVLVVGGAASPALATDYYVSPGGSDTAPGITAERPFQTLDRINQIDLNPGDRVLLEGGQSFAGQLYLDESDRGTPARPVRVASYGTGRASLRPDANGIYAYNSAGIEISELDVFGTGRDRNRDAGISFYMDLADDVRLDTVTIRNVEVSGFGNAGIIIGSWNGRSGYSKVTIDGVSAHDNGDSGISTYSQELWGLYQVRVTGSRAYNNAGNPGSDGNTGSGIVLGGVDLGLVEHCLAYDNGWLNRPARHEGPVGIWTYNSNRVTIQYNESFRNRTANQADGGGFDLDGGTTASVLQFNYSHDNDGAGFLVYQYSGAPLHDNNTIRYNISQNDGRTGSYGGIHAGAAITNLYVYNNTVFVSPSATGSPAGIDLTAIAGTDHFFWNNLIIVTGNIPMIRANTRPATRFDGNAYWNPNGRFRVEWDATVYADLGGWRNGTGQELIGGAPTGMHVDPLVSDQGAGSTIGDPTRLHTLTAYRLNAASPLVDAGLDLQSNFGRLPGSTDYHQTPIPQDSRFDIGASELLSGTTGALNVIANAGFESRLSGWENWGNSTTISGQGANGSLYALRVGTAAGGVGQDVISRLVPGSRYRLTASARIGSSTIQSWVGIKFFTSSGEVLFEQAVQVTSSAYTASDMLDFVAPSGASRAYVYYWKDAGAVGYTNADDYRLEAVP
jgi:hypothetical protein